MKNMLMCTFPIDLHVKGHPPIKSRDLVSVGTEGPENVAVLTAGFYASIDNNYRALWQILQRH